MYTPVSAPPKLKKAKPKQKAATKTQTYVPISKGSSPQSKKGEQYQSLAQISKQEEDTSFCKCPNCSFIFQKPE